MMYFDADGQLIETTSGFQAREQLESKLAAMAGS